MPLNRGSPTYTIKCKWENQIMKGELRLGGEGEGEIKYT
jgi:hypothetical protein